MANRGFRGKVSYRPTYAWRKSYDRPQGLLSIVLNRFLPMWLTDLIGVNPPEIVKCRIFPISEPSFLRPGQPYVHYSPNYLELHHSGVSKRLMNNVNLDRYWEPRSYGLPGIGVAPCNHFMVQSFAKKQIFPETVFEREMRLFRAETLYPDPWTVDRNPIGEAYYSENGYALYHQLRRNRNGKL